MGKIIHFLIIFIILIPSISSIILNKVNSEEFIEIDDYSINPWPMYGGGPTHARRLPFSLPDDLILEKDWEKGIPREISKFISISENGTMYILTDYGDLIAISKNGDFLWEFDGKGSIRDERPSIGLDGTIFYSTDAFQIYAILPNGTLKWNRTIGYNVKSYSPPIVSKNGNVYVGTGDGVLYAFDPNGSLLWKRALCESLYYSPALDEDGNIYVNGAGGTVIKLLPTGIIIWQVKIGNYSHCCLSLTDNREVIVANDDGSLFCIDEKGIIKWNFTIYTWTGPGLTMPIQNGIAIGSEGRILFISSYTLYSLSNSGELIWKLDIGTLGELFVDNEGSVYINDEYLRKIKSSGEIITGSEINSKLPILIASEDVIFTCDNSILTKYQITKSHRPTITDLIIENESVTLFWNPPSDNTIDEIVGYRIMRSDMDGLNSEVIGETDNTFINDTPPEINQYYSYEVVTLTIYGESIPSLPWKVFYTYKSEIEIIDLNIKAEKIPTGIRLTFNSTRIQEISVIMIFRSEEGEDFRYIGSIYYPENEYYDEQISYGSKYQYYCEGYSEYVGYHVIQQNSESDIVEIKNEYPDEHGNQFVIIIIIMVSGIVFIAVIILIFLLIKKRKVSKEDFKEVNIVDSNKEK